MSNQVVPITAEELRRLTDSLPEGKFLLVDVRQPEEYAQRHIPGAKLVPLGEIEQGGAAVGPAENTVVYCRSGARSMRAAQRLLARQRPGQATIYNLTGGINAYHGTTLVELPRLRAFERATTVSEVARQAMEQEKGSHLLSRHMLPHFEGTAQHAKIEQLAASELSHGAALYEMLAAAGEKDLGTFHELFERMEGRLLESGEPLDVAVRRLMQQPEHSHAAVLELALQSELEAYDLYRNMADQNEDRELREAFMRLAGQEQAHARALLDSLGELAAA